MIKRIVADASPLIAFARIDRLPLIFELLGSILIPDAVADECLVNQFLPGAQSIVESINKGLIEVRSDQFNLEATNFLGILGKGEAAAIRLALLTDSPILIDEKLGRNVAKKYELKIIGTAGILLLAKQHKLITEVHPIITQLKNCGYHLSNELIEEVLKRAAEK